MPSELRACPFCGKQPRLGYMGDEDGGYFYAECDSPSHFCGSHMETEAEAIAAWNTRPQPTEAREGVVEALTPSGDTKAAYMGEFAFKLTRVDDAGDEYSEKVFVPWTTIKEIMAAIRKRAALSSLSPDKGGMG